jgi:hypothetical protein
MRRRYEVCNVALNEAEAECSLERVTENTMGVEYGLRAKVLRVLGR